jgi:hypothetical protein
MHGGERKVQRKKVNTMIEVQGKRGHLFRHSCLLLPATFHDLLFT